MSLFSNKFSSVKTPQKFLRGPWGVSIWVPCKNVKTVSYYAITCPQGPHSTNSNYYAQQSVAPKHQFHSDCKNALNRIHSFGYGRKLLKIGPSVVGSGPSQINLKSKSKITSPKMVGVSKEDNSRSLFMISEWRKFDWHEFTMSK